MDTTSTANISRNRWNAITTWPEFARQLEREAEKAGAYTTGIESDKKNRGQAINTDLFGYDEAQGLIVIQVRQAIFHPRRYTEVRKNYLLVGRNEETGEVFAHPVDSPARSKNALATPEATVAYVLAKIWDCRQQDLPDIIRQGDVAFVPVPSLPQGAVPVDGPVVLRNTHRLTGEIYLLGAQYYTTRRATLKHTKGQHATIKAKGGFYRVQTGNRANLWDFSERRGD